MFASVRHWFVVGFQASAAKTEPASLNCTPVLLPPITSTSPVGSVTELWNARANAIGAADEITGLGPLRSI